MRWQKSGCCVSCVTSVTLASAAEQWMGRETLIPHERSGHEIHVQNWSFRFSTHMYPRAWRQASTPSFLLLLLLISASLIEGDLFFSSALSVYLTLPSSPSPPDRCSTNRFQSLHHLLSHWLCSSLVSCSVSEPSARRAFHPPCFLSCIWEMKRETSRTPDVKLRVLLSLLFMPSLCFFFFFFRHFTRSPLWPCNML